MGFVGRGFSRGKYCLPVEMMGGWGCVGVVWVFFPWFSQWIHRFFTGFSTGVAGCPGVDLAVGLLLVGGAVVGFVRRSSPRCD